ncbi:MAG: hypothetical protein FWC33_02000 [Candidatus Bathyarchaeota archaeon]|nr:hypothetical protein [Candidatus Termiticorpusculum sp.]
MNKVSVSLAIVCIALAVFSGFCVMNIKVRQDIIDISVCDKVANREILYQRANDYTKFVVNCDYAGYVFVRIDSSTSRNNYASVSYTSKAGSSAHIVTYEKQVNLAQGDWFCFPVLPGGVTIHVGNTEWYNDVTQTVTIEYWY